VRGPLRHNSGEDANLQADVMRFMAIVAFCLIAILAMVKQTAPPTAAAPTAQQSAAPIPPLVQPRIEPAAPPPSPPQPAATTFELFAEVDQPAKPKSRQTTSPAPAAPPKPIEAARTPPRKAAVQAVTPQQSPPQAAADTTAVTTAATPAARETEAAPYATEINTATPEAGLTLRFASEQDFLRLVGRGKVTVFAYDQARFLSLDRSHRFHAATPPRQVYELDTQTIPRLVRAALPSEFAASEFTWAVALPQRVEQQISDFVGRVDSGELHINRYEEVRHVPAS